MGSLAVYVGKCGDDFGNDVNGGLAHEARVVGEDEPVAENGQRQRLDVFDGGVGPLVEQGAAFAAAARARAARGLAPKRMLSERGPLPGWVASQRRAV